MIGVQIPNTEDALSKVDMLEAENSALKDIIDEMKISQDELRESMKLRDREISYLRGYIDGRHDVSRYAHVRH